MTDARKHDPQDASNPDEEARSGGMMEEMMGHCMKQWGSCCGSPDDEEEATAESSRGA